MITRLRYPKGYQFFDANGVPLALGKLFYYGAGTTAAQDTYANSAATAANTNPIVLDGSGRIPCDIYLGSAADYKEVLTTSSGAVVAPWPDDNIPRAGQADWNATSGPSQILNKPTLAAVAASGSYNDLSNTPAAIAIFTGDTGSGGTSGLVPAPAAGTAVADKFLKSDGTWAVPPGGSGSAATNLTVTETANNVALASSSGSGVTIPAATSTAAGVLDSARAIKIDSLAAVASTGSYNDLSNKPSIAASPSTMAGATASAAGNGGLVPAPSAGEEASFLRGDATWATPSISGGSTNITLSQTPAKVTVNSSTGSGIDVPAATISNAGVMTAADRVTLNGLGTASAQNVPATGNATSGQVVLGSDTRLSDARTPQAHASTHATGGSDPISLAASQVSGIPASLASQNLDGVARIGIGTTDSANKLSVSAPSVLFSNSGDMRATISKGASSNTAAFNFQDNFSTRVQFGLLGNDDFSVSTSPDGNAFNNGLVVNNSTGAVTFPNTGGFNGDSGSGGSGGLVPAPAARAAASGKFLKADGTWSVPPVSIQVNSDWNATGGTAQILNKPALSASATTDTTNASNISSGTLSVGRLPLFTSSENGAVPSSGGGSVNFLRSDGTWTAPAGVSPSNMAAATSGTAGAAGLVPAPSAGQQNLFLRGDASFADPGAVLSHLVVRDTAISGFTDAKWEVIQVAGQSNATDTSGVAYTLSVSPGELVLLRVDYVVALADLSKCCVGSLSKGYKNIAGTISGITTSGAYTSDSSKDNTAAISVGFTNVAGNPVIYVQSDSSSSNYNYFINIRILHMKTNS